MFTARCIVFVLFLLVGMAVADCSFPPARFPSPATAEDQDEAENAWSRPPTCSRFRAAFDEMLVPQGPGHR